MDVISSALSGFLTKITSIGVTDVIDILVVAFLIYKIIQFVRRTSSYNLAKGIILVFLVLWLSELFRLTMISYLIRNLMELGLIALLILFQPELRRILERVGSSLTSGRQGSSTVMSTGTIINADITSELIKNIFYNKAPLHDGALVIRDTRLAAAGCVLPLTQSTNLSKDLGMRHRAGIGLSEQSDAVVVIVSEETGAISVAIEGMLKRHLTAATLDKLLHSELVQEETENSKRSVLLAGLRKLLKGEKNEQDKPDEKNL